MNINLLFTGLDERRLLCVEVIAFAFEPRYENRLTARDHSTYTGVPIGFQGFVDRSLRVLAVRGVKRGSCRHGTTPL